MTRIELTTWGFIWVLLPLIWAYFG